MFDDPKMYGAIDYTGLSQGVSVGLESMDILTPDVVQNKAGGALLDEGVATAQGLLSQFASSSGFQAQLRVAFGDDYDWGVAQTIAQQWANDNFSGLPEIRVLSSEVMEGAYGAFAASTNTIYLSEDFLRNGNLSDVVSVILEETGHYLDSQINRFDAAGDEGEIFSRVVRGIPTIAQDLSILRGEDDSGVITVDGLQVAIEKNYFPINLYDSSSYLWDIYGNGTINNGTYDAYDGGLSHSGFSSQTSYTTEDNGREIVLGSTTINGLSVTRKIYVPTGQSFARFLEIVTNPTANAINYSLNLNSNLGSDSSTVLVNTSSGDTSFTTGDNWIITDDYDGGGDPTMLHLFAGNGGAIRPTSVSLSGDNLSYGYNLNLQPGETRIIMHFAVQNPSQATALSQANSLNTLGLNALTGMTTQEIYQVANFNALGRSSISLNQTINGTLSSTDPLNASFAGRYVDEYRLTGISTGQQVRINLNSSAFDAYLQLVNAVTGEVIASNDDANGSLNSQIDFTVQSGISYLIRATSLGSGITGNYAISVAPSQPDLVITNQYAPSSASAGSTVTVSAYTRNQGTASAGYNYVRYWLSDDTTLNTSTDRHLGYNYVNSLTAGSSEYDSFSFTYDASWGTGTKYILFQADGYNYVSESNESNNVAYSAITINGASDNVPSTYQPFNASQVFSLHTNPNANHTIYLDFDGHTTTNTSWNDHYGSSIETPTYDIDGNTSSFSTTEYENIWNIWRRVAEDFIPFNVNVTTAAPSLSDLIKTDSNDTRWGIRVVIGGNGSWYGSAGGVAYLDSFNWNSDTPTFVFSNNIGSVKGVAEAISHEVGHTLGLNHDGKTDGTEYYWGHNGWASIMGVGYYQELTQWSKGQYSLANNTEDDLAIITGNNGFGYRTDDYGNSLNSGSSLFFNGSTVRTYGIIERNTDSDWFTFNSTGGDISFIQNQVMPTAPLGDALHLALASYHKCDFLQKQHHLKDKVIITS